VRRTVRRSMATVLAGAVFCLGVAAPKPVLAHESTVSLSLEDYSWQELNDDGSRVLKESGGLVGLEFAYQHEFPNHVAITPRVENRHGIVISCLPRIFDFQDHPCICSSKWITRQVKSMRSLTCLVTTWCYCLARPLTKTRAFVLRDLWELYFPR
jgi:hypothetical protein